MDGKLGCAGLVLVLLATGSGVARATNETDKTAARDLAKAGKRDFDAGHLEDAEQKFRRAYAIARVPTLAVWTARVLVKRGRLVEASDYYRQADRLEPNDLWIGNAQGRAQADAKRELAALEPRIPKVRVQVQGAPSGEVELSIDDVKEEREWVELDLPVDPGRHRIVGKLNGQTSMLAVDVQEGERKEALLTFEHGKAVAAAGANLGAPALASSPKPLLASSQARVDTAANLTASPPPRQPAAASHPVYERWWFWTGVGAVVVAGVVTAIVLTRHSGGPCSGASYQCLEVQ